MQAQRQSNNVIVMCHLKSLTRPAKTRFNNLVGDSHPAQNVLITSPRHHVQISYGVSCFKRNNNFVLLFGLIVFRQRYKLANIIIRIIPDIINNDFSAITSLVRSQSVRCLAPETWLNDEVINFYLQLLKDACNSEWNQIHVHTTFMLLKLSNNWKFQTKNKYVSNHADVRGVLSLFLMSSSYVPHVFLMSSSYTPHLFLTPLSGEPLDKSTQTSSLGTSPRPVSSSRG